MRRESWNYHCWELFKPPEFITGSLVAFTRETTFFFYNELIAEIWDLHLIPGSASVHILTFWSSTVAYTVARKWKAARRKYVVKIVCKVYFYDFYDKPRRHELTRSVHSNLSKLTMRCTLQRSKTRKIIACRGCKFFFVWESVSLAENVMSAKGENWRLKWNTFSLMTEKCLPLVTVSLWDEIRTATCRASVKILPLTMIMRASSITSSDANQKFTWGSLHVEWKSYYPSYHLGLINFHHISLLPLTNKLACSDVLY